MFAGQIMMFLAVVTLEITNDLTYMPAIALAAIIGCFTGRQLCHGVSVIHVLMYDLFCNFSHWFTSTQVSTMS